MTSDRSKDESNAQDATRDETSSSQESSSQSGWASGHENAEQEREQPVSGMVSQRPDLPPSPAMALGDAMNGFLRGMLPPQGLDAFVEEVRTTASQVGNMYANLFRFQVESVERAISETRLGRNKALEDHEHSEQK